MDGFLYFICFGAAILGAEAAGVGSYSFQDSSGNSVIGFGPVKMQPMRSLFGSGGLGEMRSMMGMGMGSFSGFASNMGTGLRNMPQNGGAFALANIANDVGHQIAAINPENPNNPNVDTISRLSDKNPSDPQYHSVMTSSFSSSGTSPNGETIQKQSAHTIIDNNGDVKEYHVEN